MTTKHPQGHSEQHLDMVKAQDEQPIIENYPEKDNLQQEPVAWIDIDEKGSASGLRYWSEPDNRHEVALYILKE